VNEHHGKGVPADSPAAREYLRSHDFAVRWARANRALIAQRFVAVLGAEAECVWDGCHNSITPGPRISCSSRGNEAQTSGQHGCAIEQEAGRNLLTPPVQWIHRKGAVAVDSNPRSESAPSRDAAMKAVVIPGSRGALSYLVKPIGDGESHAWSLAHGAGRKWARSETRLRMRERFGPRQLAQTPLGGRVICEQRNLLYEEAPAAYKDIETVIQDLVDAGLVSVIATFRPLLTYKTRKVSR
jgi:release factor H-coupled RctB family protein